MVNGITPPTNPALAAVRTGPVARGTPVHGPRPADTNAAAAAPSPAADLAASGAPVDGAKVAAIRAAIADGSYRADPKAIAERMVDLDLPKAP